MWMTDQVPMTLHSPLSSADCAARLSGALGKSWAPIPRRPFAGRVDGADVRIEKTQFYNNTVRRFFYARLVPHADGGTDIAGTFRVAPHYVAANLSLPVIVGCVIVYAAFGGVSGLDGVAEAVVAGLLLALTIWGGYRLGRYLAKDEPEQITRFLIETLDARVVEPGRHRR